MHKVIYAERCGLFFLHLSLWAFTNKAEQSKDLRCQSWIFVKRLSVLDSAEDHRIRIVVESGCMLLKLFKRGRIVFVVIGIAGFVRMMQPVLCSGMVA